MSKSNHACYKIGRHAFHVPIPPQRSMSYDEASRWVAMQSSGNQVFYKIT
ncbi:hypothetical protein [uncultured Alteromonas sp.]